MRKFTYITVGKILDELWEELRDKIPEEDRYKITNSGEKVKKWPITRITFHNMEKKLGFPIHRKSDYPKAWRVYTAAEARQIKTAIKKKLRLIR